MCTPGGKGRNYLLSGVCNAPSCAPRSSARAGADESLATPGVSPSAPDGSEPQRDSSDAAEVLPVEELKDRVKLRIFESGIGKKEIAPWLKKLRVAGAAWLSPSGMVDALVDRLFGDRKKSTLS